MQLILKKMIKSTIKIMENAYIPKSNFPVGACIRTPDNKLFAGCNFENASWPLTVCAETAAIANMISSGYKQISEIVIMSKAQAICTPCGACRQRMFEFAEPDMKVHLCDSDGKIKLTLTITELLPEAFRY